MKLFFIRHGQTDWNKDKILIGNNEPPLNDLGIQQAREALKSLNTRPNIIYSSPQIRAYQTAEIIAEHFNLPIIADPRLKERDFGALSGHTWEENQEKYGIDFRSIDIKLQYDYRPYGGESAEDVKARLLGFLEDIKQKTSDNVYVVAHGGIIKMAYFILKNEEFTGVLNASVHEFDLV